METKRERRRMEVLPVAARYVGWSLVFVRWDDQKGTIVDWIGTPLRTKEEAVAICRRYNQHEISLEEAVAETE